MKLLDRPDVVRVALGHPRGELLGRLARPASAPELARELGLTRQKVNYHLRALENAGLIELVETRQRRGCMERVMQATAETFVVDPTLFGDQDDVLTQDRYASEHLVATASSLVRDVTRMRTAADTSGERLLTFTVEASVGFTTPRSLEEFTDALTAAVSELANRFHDPSGRPYSVVLAGHPSPSTDQEDV